MMQKIQSLVKKERGNIMVLFAGSLIIMIAFIGLSLDIGMLSLQRNSLQNLSQVIREDRFTYQDQIRYADDPAKKSYEIIYNTLEKNGFDGTLKIYFYEFEQFSNHREYRIRTVLTQEYSWSFARVLGMSTTTISSTLDGREIYGEGGVDMVWHSEISPLTYNGSYTSLPGGGYVHNSSDIPANMKTP